MNTVLRAFAAAAWLSPWGAAAQDSGAIEAAIAALRAAEPGVRWDARSAASADFTCDGRKDTAVVGYEKNEAVWIGVVPGPGKKGASKPATMRFPVGKDSQDSFCAVPVRIKARPIRCEDEEMGNLPGCKPAKGCSAFSMDDDACDSFHFYWDSSGRKLAWWRR